MQQTPWSRRLLGIGGRIAVAALLLWIIFARVQFRQVSATLARIDPRLAALALVAMLLVGGIAAAKWLTLLRGLRVPVRAGAVLRLSYIAATWNLALPGGESGNLVKAALLARQTAGQTGKIWAATLVDQLSLGAAQLFVAFLTLALTQRPPADLRIWLIALGVFLVGIALVYALFLAPRIADYLDGPVARLSRALAVPARFRRATDVIASPTTDSSAESISQHPPGEWLAPLWQGLIRYRGHWRSLSAALALAVAYYGAIFFAYWLAARGLAIPYSYADIAWVTALASVAALLPITIAGVGVREGVITYYLQQHGVGAAQALSFSLAVLALNLALGVPGVLLQLLAGGSKNRGNQGLS